MDGDHDAPDEAAGIGGAVRLAVRSVRGGVVLIAEETDTGAGCRVLLSAEEAALLSDALLRGIALHQRLAAAPAQVGHA